MILRAKPKSADDLGPTCCEKMRASLLAFQQEIEVESGPRLKKTLCAFCRKPFLGMRIRRMRGWRINPKWWEIAEGVR